MCNNKREVAVENKCKSEVIINLFKVEIQIKRMTSRSNKWINFEFNGNASPKRSNESNADQQCDFVTIRKRVSNKQPATFNFLEKLQPQTVEQLAVQQKKVKDVEEWLQGNCGRASPILLLTGPTGCGKTATIKVLCKQLNIRIREWVNPVDEDADSFTQSQLVNFYDFFTQGKYVSLLDDIDRKHVLLIEDFPNFVVFKPTEFGEVLRRCFSLSVPVIFICTDTSSSKVDLSQSLFPQDVRELFKITNIKFNPCTITSLQAALKRAKSVVAAYPDLFCVPPTDCVDAIISTAMGDIRHAINQYHFACLKGATKIPIDINFSKNSSKKRKRKEKPATLLKFMVKDETLGFFHGLGKVLNPKRSQTDGDSWRLQCDIPGLIDQFNSQPTNFNSFLQENYLKYFGDINNVQKASEFLSEGQVFLAAWSESQELHLYSLWLAVLGLMVCNEHPVSKWNQITAPKRVKPILENKLEVRNIEKTDYLYYNIITGTDKFHIFK